MEQLFNRNGHSETVRRRPQLLGCTTTSAFSCLFLADESVFLIFYVCILECVWEVCVCVCVAHVIHVAAQS